jgi:hypothetical protein
MVPRWRRNDAASKGVPIKSKREEFVSRMARCLSNAATRDVRTMQQRVEFVGDMAPLNLKGINSAVLVYVVVNVFLEESIVKNTMTLMIILITTKCLVIIMIKTKRLVS